MESNPSASLDPASLFPETADIETASDDYAKRFAGPSGEWMLAVQERLALSFVSTDPGLTVLDVGGGHGQLTLPLCRRNVDVTVLGSSEACRKRIASLVDAGRCRFTVGNVIDLPFPDRSFDTVLCFRLLTHCSAWPVLVKELCRVARRNVVADYPTSQSVNAIAPALFEAKKKVERNTRHWSLFRHEDIRQAFELHGFTIRRRAAQFFLPMVLHRALRCRPLSAGLEGVFRATGLTRAWGSPVIIDATLIRPSGSAAP